MNPNICIIFILSLFISSNRSVAQDVDKSTDQNVEYIILTSEKLETFETKDKITRWTTPQDYYTESPSIFFMYKSSKVEDGEDGIEFDFIHRIYNTDRFRKTRMEGGKDGKIYPYEMMVIRKIPRAEIRKLKPFDLDKAIEKMTKEESLELLKSWEGKKLGIIDRSDISRDSISVYEANIVNDISSHWQIISSPSFMREYPHPQLILPDSTGNQNIKGNLYMLINNIGAVINYYKLGYPSDNKSSKETMNITCDGKSLSVSEFNDLKNIPQDSIKIQAVRISNVSPGSGKTSISIETRKQ